jgi:hypothetical protein
MKKPAVGSEESRQSPVKKVSSQTDVRSRKAATCKLKIDRNLSTKILEGEMEGWKNGTPIAIAGEPHALRLKTDFYFFVPCA